MCPYCAGIAFVLIGTKQTILTSDTRSKCAGEKQHASICVASVRTVLWTGSRFTCQGRSIEIDSTKSILRDRCRG